MVIIVVGESTLEVLKAAVVPAVGGATIAILVLQYLLAKRQWLLELYERRYPVYKRTLVFVWGAWKGRTVSEEELKIFGQRVDEHVLLFGKDVEKHLEEVWDKARRMRKVEELRKAQEGGREELVRLAGEEKDLVEWFGEQREVTVRKFARYLAVGRKGRMGWWWWFWGRKKKWVREERGDGGVVYGGD